MIHWLKWLFDFPTRHPTAAWWVSVLGLSGVTIITIIKPLWRFLKLLPIWGVKYARSQRAVKIRALERLHEDTNRLILYVLRDALATLLDLCGMLFSLAWFAWIAPVITLKTVLIFMALSFGAGTVGRAIRLRGMVNALMDYDASLATLKRKQGTD